MRTLLSTLIAALPAAALAPSQLLAQEPREWPIHSMERPQPPVVRAAPARAGAPPSDAIVLFDGRSLAAWRSADDTTRPARWRIADGFMEVVKGTGAIETRRAFGDVQLHIEWASPATPHGEGQERGNSGVFLMGRYEVQVLDSYRNRTYPDGQAAALYGQRPPLVNASRPPGEWQTYDIVFRRPRFDAAGKLLQPARVTVLHNGVELTGPSAHQARPPYEKHADRLPISLQDHGVAVRFRNVWVRELE